METLAPPLEWTMWIRGELENGASLSFSLKRGLKTKDDSLSIQIQKILAVHELGKLQKPPEGNNIYRKVLLSLLIRGLAGEPILNHLRELEEELIMASEIELDKYIATLPIKVMLPVLLLQFPAFLLLMLAPLINQFMKGF